MVLQRLFMKENQLADYILGTNNSPPTPIKTSDYNNNILSHSYSQKRRMYIKDYPNLLNIKNDKDIDNYNILRSKTFNLDDFFNKDEKKKDNANNVKESIKTKEAQDKVEKDYESIFKDLKKAHEYTKKYSVIDEDDIPINIYVTGPDVVNKRKMYNYDYIGQLTMMYSAKHFGLIQIKDIKKNNDYAIRLQLFKKAGTEAHLLKENLAKYRIRKKSISHDKLSKKLKSHFDLFHMCDEKPAIVAIWYACWNMWFGVLKKKNYEKKI